MMRRSGLAGQGELAAFGFDEAAGVALGLDLTQDRGVHGVDNVGESGLTIERMIDRSRLQPRYGSGWQSA